MDLNENEKIIFEILQNKKNMLLSDLKTQSGLSNKGWDKAIKSLTKQGLAKVVKTNDQLTITHLD